MTLTELRSARRREGHRPYAQMLPPAAGGGLTVAPEPDSPANFDDFELEFSVVRLGSVAKVTAFFGLATLVLWMGATLFFWTFASSAGLIGKFEELMRDIGFEGFRVEAGPVFLAIGLVGALCVIALLTVVVVASASYNAFAAFFGGVRVVATPRPLANGTAQKTVGRTTDGEAPAPARGNNGAAPIREP